MYVTNPRKSWLSLVMDWPSLLNKDPYIFSNVAVSLLVKSLEVIFGLLEYSSFDSLVRSWDEGDTPNGLEGAKACFRRPSSLYGELIKRFWIEM